MFGWIPLLSICGFGNQTLWPFMIFSAVRAIFIYLHPHKTIPLVISLLNAGIFALAFFWTPYWTGSAVLFIVSHWLVNNRSRVKNAAARISSPAAFLSKLVGIRTLGVGQKFMDVNVGELHMAGVVRSADVGLLRDMLRVHPSLTMLPLVADKDDFRRNKRRFDEVAGEFPSIQFEFVEVEALIDAGSNILNPDSLEAALARLRERVPIKTLVYSKQLGVDASRFKMAAHSPFKDLNYASLEDLIANLSRHCPDVRVVPFDAVIAASLVLSRQL